MNNQDIKKICKIEFQETPQVIIRKTMGICNEVYEIGFKDKSCILRTNKEKKYLYGTHKFLPIFQKLKIKTPIIIAENYLLEKFSFCYQILSKIEGVDLGLVINNLKKDELVEIAKEISNIFDNFKTLPLQKNFGTITGVDEENYENLFEIIKNKQKTVVERNKQTSVIDSEVMNILNNTINNYKNYFLKIKPRLYYDDICSKNVMIYNGKFNGLVDLDFLEKGDYLEAIGVIMASWYGDNHGEFYINEIMKKQKLNKKQQEIVKVYAIINLIYWISEEGIKFNSNSSGIVNWDNIKIKKKQILGLLNEIKKTTTKK